MRGCGGELAMLLKSDDEVVARGSGGACCRSGGKAAAGWMCGGGREWRRRGLDRRKSVEVLGWFDRIWEDPEVDAGVWRRRVRERWDN